MRGVIDLRQRLIVQVCIHLRRRDARMAEQLLDRTQILRGLQHVRGERMAQHVRMYPARYPGATRPVLEAARQYAGGNACLAWSVNRLLNIVNGE